MSFADLPRGHFKAILADPPWQFQAWAGARLSGDRRPCAATQPHYQTMTDEDIGLLPIADLAAPDCVLFMWTCWPVLQRSFGILDAWGFTYKTCGFCWVKADDRQPDMFTDSTPVSMGLGYWTRANSEVCLLATRGKPKRIHADVRQAIVEPKREHSRKPDCVHGRIERLVEGPYLELFARAQRPGWAVWGNETDKFEAAA